MILGTTEKLIPSGLLLDTMNRALRSLVLVYLNKQEMSTGWLLTNDLVIVPNFFTQKAGPYLCYLYGDPLKEMEATLVYQTPFSADKELGPSLLKLKTPAENDSQLILEIRTDIEGNMLGDPIFIPQYTGTKDSFLSFGEVKQMDAQWVSYDADTRPGSSGSPVFNAKSGRLIAVHMKRSTNAAVPVNMGLRLTDILEKLRNSNHWEEITRFYKIVDIRKIQVRSLSPEPEPTWKDIHVEAALSWTMSKASLTESEQKILKPNIIDPSAAHWVLKPAVRTVILQSRPKSQLKQVKVRPNGNTYGQRVIERILKGGPYNLDEIDEQELPFWLQAVRWFAPLDDQLPGAAEVNKSLERKRIRSRLSTLSGADFKGRQKELKELDDWYASEENLPLMISGIGGIGKSTLIGHFALSLPKNTPIFWLDFDRADLAPDDAKSVMNALSEQATLQTEGFVPPAPSAKWEEMAVQLSDSFAKCLDGLPPALLVLDGFEVAQHIKQYTEIWKTLEFILDKYDRLKIIVSGRAFVSSLAIKNKAAESIRLMGMEPKDARGLLSEHKIVEKEVVDEVVRISRGIPLILKLAIRYVDAGNRLEDLPASLPEIMIEGYLYRRILDRVMDIQLKPICRKALVLRKVTVEIIEKILLEDIPINITAPEVFEGLSREMGLISEKETLLNSGAESGFIQLRPELRTATIKLLETEDADLVKKIDRKAVDFYTQTDLNNFDNRAELIYHLLRLGELEEAKKYWLTECAPLLKYATRDLPDTASAARSWLQDQIGHVIGEQKDDIKIWEIQSVKQIKDLLSRGHFKGVSEILKQRKERSESSPLLIYDAWWAFWIEEDARRALKILAESQPEHTAVARNQNLFRAFLEARAGNTFLADQILSKININDWNDRKDRNLEILALQAARIRFTVDIDMEVAFARIFMSQLNDKAILMPRIAAKDVVYPLLTEFFSQDTGLESRDVIMSKLPTDEEELVRFANFIAIISQKQSSSQLDVKASDLKTLCEANQIQPISQNDNSLPSEHTLELMERLLAIQGAFRWQYATTSLILADMAKLAVRKKEELPSLEMSILASLAAFRGLALYVSVEGYEEKTIDCFLKMVLRNNPESTSPLLSEERKLRLLRFMNEEMAGSSMTRAAIVLRSNLEQELKKQNNFFSLSNSLKFLTDSAIPEELVSTVLYLFGPDPLEMLCRRIIGFPDNYKFSIQYDEYPGRVSLSVA